MLRRHEDSSEPVGRRRVLTTAAAVAAVAATTGCLDPVAPPQSPPSGTTTPGTPSGTAAPEEPTSTPSPPAIDCDAASRPTPEPDGGDVAPAEYPPPPERGSGGGLEEDAVGSYAMAHERAYVRNGALESEGPLGGFGFTGIETATEPRPTGAVAYVHYRYYLTSEEFHADSPGLTAAYYVDRRGALRTRDSGSDLLTYLDPVADGEPVVCFE